MNYADLIQNITTNIATNGVQAITAQVLQEVLVDMVGELGQSGSLIGGVVDTSFVPDSTNDASVVYIASGAGTYPNFGGLTVAAGEVALFYYDGTAWAKKSVSVLDENLTELDLTQWKKTVVNEYISLTTGKWTYSNSTTSFWLPVVAGARYKIVSQTGKNARYAILKTAVFTSSSLTDTTPDFATGETEVHQFTGEADIVIPADGCWMVVSLKLSGDDITPRIYAYPQPTGKMYTTNMALSVHTMLEARTNQDKFGVGKAATNDSWGISQPIWVKDAKKVVVFTSTLSTSSSYYDITGSIFYDKSLVPMTQGMDLLKRGTTASATWHEISVPTGANYLIITSGMTYQGNSVQVYFEDRDSVLGVGNSQALEFSYYGEKIVLNENKYSLATIANNAQGSNTAQGSAVYGNYLFMVHEYLATVKMLNLKNNVRVDCTTGITSDTFWHCNQASFGALKYDADDMFPVLYVSQQNDTNGCGLVHTLRIIPTLADGEITAFTVSIVQSIHLPAMTDSNCLGNPNWTYDPDNDCAWVYSRNNNSNAANYREAHFTKFAIPSLSVSDVTLTDADILDTFHNTWSMYNGQGACINNGRLYIVQGYVNAGYIWLRGIDLYAKRTQVTLIDLLADGMTDEPEGVFIWDGCLCFSTHTSPVYKLIVK